ncbi:MAG: hypothetical protein A2Z34_08140 [Planctomycetes bacterium RBG_16_59_8]|nr:MAG: hypothetical protein A2Z34_08140 [Planctomycetes bacterium RBG_16_59_8]
MKSQPIEKIRKVYKREWLLIAIDAMDESTTTPVRGRLLAHSPRRQDIYEKSRQYPHPALVVYSEDRFPKGFAAAFYEA